MNSSANATPSGMLHIRRSPPVPSVVFDTYWHFASERQAIYHKRVRRLPAPWTDNAVLRQFKFTNPFRASDRVSQFLIRRVIYEPGFGFRDTVMRTLLFKLFNKIETWELLENVLGPVDERSFDVDRYGSVLSAAMATGSSIYSGAYIMPSGPKAIRRGRKHEMHLAMLKALMREDLPVKLEQCRSTNEAYALLLAIPGIGPFLAYQFATDLNYGPQLEFSEGEFVVPGPGARDGLRKCFITLGDYSEGDAIRWVTERQDQEFERLGLVFENLWGRPLQLIDCQNLFCEVDKYSRVAHPNVIGYTGRTRIKQRFRPSPHSIQQPWFPPKWEINDRVPLVD